MNTLSLLKVLDETTEINMLILMNTNTFNFIYIYPTPLHKQDVTEGNFFKQSLTSLNSEFSFFLTSCHTKLKKIQSILIFIHS